jgi:stress response protein SCP2
VAIKLSKSNFNQNVIRIHRDNVTGFGDDDEMMDIDLSRIPDTFNKIAILVNVHKGEIRSTYFGKVPNTSISISKNGWQIYSCNITSRYAKYNAVVPAYFIRDKKSNKWKLKTKGTVLHGDSITQVLSSYKLVEKHIFKKVEG